MTQAEVIELLSDNDPKTYSLNPDKKDWEIANHVWGTNTGDDCKIIKMLRRHGQFKYLGNGFWRAWDKRLLYIDDPNYREGDKFRRDYYLHNSDDFETIIEIQKGVNL